MPAQDIKMCMSSLGHRRGATSCSEWYNIQYFKEALFGRHNGLYSSAKHVIPSFAYFIAAKHVCIGYS